ncbi:hypothetical protein CYMTET_42683 [Cymbomonas tetramitiformis]|uniref:Uncharacterized protein n=1 Tax=Cymbomonas tetramitiformis TaxID=36881 RepID=A0AAE0F1F2_9CHLO|nr:hypothetical protein CYMTET_42683 [Cymbomonas tetramitiformis]
MGLSAQEAHTVGSLPCRRGVTIRGRRFPPRGAGVIRHQNGPREVIEDPIRYFSHDRRFENSDTSSLTRGAGCEGTRKLT